MKNPTSPIGFFTFTIMAALVAAGCAMEVAEDGSQQDDEGDVAVVSQALMLGSHGYTFYQKANPLNGQDFHFTYTCLAAEAIEGAAA